jgi:hypothetical protein
MQNSPITIKLDIESSFEQYEISQILRDNYSLLEGALSLLIKGILLKEASVKIANQCSAYDNEFIPDICVDFSR